MFFPLSIALRHFYMDDCGLMDDDIAILCDAAEHHATLRTLSLDSNNTMVKGFTRIHDMLKTNTPITSMGHLRSLPEVG